MGVNSAIELKSILSVNRNIAHLCLKKNAFGDIGVRIIMKAVKKSTNLVHLDLSSNDITYQGAKKIFKSLRKNTSLVSLVLGSIDGVHKNRVG